ncbi:MAG: hypothetical protein PHO10_09155 [Gemmiger sp.]|nr:hypothetical protein [Gemmiger sp.]
MNRLDYAQLMEEVEKELTMPGGNFDALYGHDPKMLEQARFITAVALTATDRLYARLTKMDFDLREQDEHG